MVGPGPARLAAPIAAPADFPVTWEDPHDERLFWTRERVHYPDQMSPLQASLLTEGFAPGWYAAAAAYELPVVGPRGRLINTYIYTTMVPVLAPPAELAARGKRCQEKLGAAGARLGELWYGEWLPEVERYIVDLAGFDLHGATVPALLAHLEEALARWRRVAEIHFLAFSPMMSATGAFDELYRDLFGSSEPFAAYRLLQGFDNKSLETDRALWQLSRQAVAEPAVHEALRTRAAAEVPTALAESPAGRSFLEALQAFLAQYGRRGDKPTLDGPFWVEDPAPVVTALQHYVLLPDRDPAAELAALAAERERLVAEAQARLAGYPQPVVVQFAGLLKTAQTATVLWEDHAFWLDQSFPYEIRRLILELGRRLAAAGVLAAADDVFYLTLPELRETAAGLPGLDRHGVVRARQAEYERFRGVTPPPALGTPPPGPPPDNPFARAAGRFFGTPPRPSAEPGILRGSAGSPGMARGPARVVRRLAEAAKLQPGDILVAETTTPTWTPLFATVAAVVTDSGGILSHCAIVAREYRIPAVVGTGLATGVIRDGQIVEVDGDAGEVRLVAVG